MNDAEDRADLGCRSEVFYIVWHPLPVKNLRPSARMAPVFRIFHSPVAAQLLVSAISGLEQAVRR